MSFCLSCIAPSIDEENGRVGLHFKRQYGSHGMLRFDGWSKLGADEDRTEWLDSADGDANLNIYMLVK